MPLNVLQTNRKVLPEIAMRRTTTGNLCGLIVEGITDRKFFEKFVAAEHCAVFQVGGKSQVVDTVTQASSSRMVGVLGVVDGDIDLFLGRAKPTGNVVRVDGTDVESLMFASTAFVHLFREISLRDGDLRNGEAIVRLAERARSKIVRAAFLIGLVRYAALQCDMGVAFTNLSYHTFVNSLTCDVDVEAFFTAVLALSRTKLNDEAAKQVFETMLKEHEAHDAWHVVRGHDLTRIAALCSENLIGHRRNSAEIEQALRLAYDSEDLRRTSVYADIMEWTVRNQPFVVWQLSPTASETTAILPPRPTH